MSLRLVLIEWEDSAQPIASWEYLNTVQGALGESNICFSVGWLVYDGELVKALAPNMADLYDLSDKGNPQVSGVLRIPVRSIVRIVDLPDPSPNAEAAEGPEG